MPLAPAFRLGPYEVVELLSAGSMGEVYRARDVRLGRHVAVKVLPAEFADDRERLHRFEQEAQAAGALNHPNVVAVFDVGREGDISFVVSELVDGVTLRDVAGKGPLSSERVAAIGSQVARGLAAAHAGGVVHRDLKPENIMVTRDGRVKIVDFGIAKVGARVGAGRDGSSVATINRTIPGALVGTVAYMSPEQVRGEEVDARSDIFSLGVILYELAAGRHPFLRSTGAETMSAILRDSPPRLAPEQARLDAVVSRATEKRREARFQSAGEMADALEAEPRGDARGPVVSRPAGELLDRADRTIAVLPFANVSSDPESEYFSDGLTEELIQALTRVRGLQVVAWHSAAQTKGRNENAREIGREFHAKTVLAGSVRKAGDRVRIAVRLIEVASGYYLWSETYDRQVEDVIAIQEEIARAIVETLAETLVGAGAPALAALDSSGGDRRASERAGRRAGNVEAYNLYLRGRFFWNKRTADGLRRSVECFQQAIESNEAFALAHAGLADAYCLLADYGVSHPSEVMPLARSAALRALELDPRSAEAHASFGLIRCVYDWEWLEGEALFRRALELNPGYATAHHWLAVDVLAMLGRFDEATDHLFRAGHLDPLSLIIHEGTAYLLMLARRYAEAVTAYEGIIELDPSFPKGYTSMGRAYIHMGNYDAAIAMLEKGRSLAGDIPSILGALGQAYALAGARSEAEALLSRLTDLATRQHVSSTAFALVHAGLGEHGRALDWLERGCDAHELPLTAIKIHPAYDGLRGEPRFAALLHRMRFPD